MADPNKNKERERLRRRFLKSVSELENYEGNVIAEQLKAINQGMAFILENMATKEDIKALDKKVNDLDKKVKSNHKKLTDKLGKLSEMHTAGALKNTLEKVGIKDYELLPNVLIFQDGNNTGELDYLLLYRESDKWNVVFIEVKTSFRYDYLSEFLHKFRKDKLPSLRFSETGKKKDAKTLLNLLKDALGKKNIKSDQLKLKFWFLFYLPARVYETKKKIKKLMRYSDLTLYEILEKGKELRKIEI